MFFRTRESDGESVPTGLGRLLLILMIPFSPLILVFTRIHELLFPRLERRRARNKGSLGSERWWQRRFFLRTGIDPAAFWLTDIQYTDVKIPKSTGGTRTLSVPVSELKLLQAAIASDLQRRLLYKVHRCANAYHPGRSIITNARPHLGCKVLIKLDIRNYFDSVTREQVRPIVMRAMRADALTDRVLDLVFCSRGLPQGAPTSPLISNLVLRRLDIDLYQACNRLRAIYTRYADDITISLKEDDSATIRSLIKIVEDLLRREGFVLNKKKGKLQVLRKHQPQRICGVTINSGRLTVSRQQRRLLRSAKHRRENTNTSTLSDDQLAGWDAYVTMVMYKPLSFLPVKDNT